jgi:hypothetical protein
MEHSIVYTTDTPPQPLEGETLDKLAIKVDIPEGGEHLHPTSRVNYSQTYTVQHNVKVKRIGTISGDWMGWVKSYWDSCNAD